MTIIITDIRNNAAFPILRENALYCGTFFPLSKIKKVMALQTRPGFLEHSVHYSQWRRFLLNGGETGVWGRSPQWGPGAEPLVRGSGKYSKSKKKLYYSVP